MNTIRFPAPPETGAPIEIAPLLTDAGPGPRRGVLGRLLHEARAALSPTLFFFVAFNVIVLTTNLLVARYFVAVGNFLLATVAALVVGKAVLVANALPILRFFDRAPLIQPILFKTCVYWIAVLIARLLERLAGYVFAHRSAAGFLAYLANEFSWHRFAALSIWVFLLFLVYVTATEFSHLFGPGEIRRLLFTRRPSDLQLGRRQRVREILQLSRLADEHSFDELRDPASEAHRELFAIVRRLAR